MKEYKNNENINNKTIFSTTFKLDIVEKSHYEFKSYNDLLKKLKNILQIIISNNKNIRYYKKKFPLGISFYNIKFSS